MDASHFNYDNPIDNASFNNLFTKSSRLAELKQALHITKTGTYQRTNNTVASAILDRENNAADVYTELLARGLKIMINVGNYDMKDGVRSTLEWIKQIDFPDRELFDQQPRKVYKYADQFDGSEKIGGWYRHHGNFTVIVVPQAGHMVPAFQPYLTMQFVKNYVDRGYLYCPTTNGSCKSVASDMCRFMNDCSGHGTCSSYGQCQCDAGFFGPDCSTVVTDLTSLEEGQVQETVEASRWLFYGLPADLGDFQLSLTSDRPVSIYVLKGSGTLPDAMTFDFLVKNENRVAITSNTLGFDEGAILAVHCVAKPGESTSYSLQLDLL